MTVNYLTCWKCLGICESIESNGVGLSECQNCGIIFETEYYQKLWDLYQMRDTKESKYHNGPAFDD